MFRRTVFASLSWWASNGDFLRVELGANLRALKARSTIDSRFPVSFSFAYVKTKFFRLPMVRFTQPVARWSFTGDYMISIPSELQNDLTAFDVKLDPWSMKIFLGTPWWYMYCLLKLRTLSLLLFPQIIAEGQRENRSTATKTYLLDSFKYLYGPQKSNCRHSFGSRGS